MTINDIRVVTGGELFLNGASLETCIGNVYMDSRKIEKGDVFVAAKGDKTDGHAYIGDVFAKGASLVICERKPEEENGAVLVVPSSISALKDIAAAYRETVCVPVVGITGSVGKTSTKEMVASVLSVAGPVLRTEGNMNNTLGLPMMVMRMRKEHTAAVLEMGISDFGEMHELSREAKPDVCVITNIGQCHLEFLHSRDGILKAKSEIFDYMSEDGSVYLNGDDDKLRTITEVKGKRPVFFGLSVTNDFYADNVVSKGLFGTSCMIHTPEGSFDVSIPLPGRHMIYNALAAAAVGMHFNLSFDQIREGIAAAKAMGGRSNIMRLSDMVVIDDCYNASPQAMRGALDLLSTANTRKVAILGDMFELGDNEEALHREIGTYCAGRADILVCVGKLSRFMKEGAEGQTECICFETLKELKEKLPDILNADDTILVKASHGMHFSEIVDLLKEKGGIV